MNKFLWLLLSVAAAHKIEDYFYTVGYRDSYVDITVRTEYGCHQHTLSHSNDEIQGIQELVIFDAFKHSGVDKSVILFEKQDNYPNQILLSFPIKVAGIDKTATIMLHKCQEVVKPDIPEYSGNTEYSGYSDGEAIMLGIIMSPIILVFLYCFGECFFN